jgi:hypothetical protein
MIPLLLASKLPLVWKYRKWIGYGIAALALLALFLTYRHGLIQKGRAEVRAEWALETAKAKTLRIKWYEEQVAEAKTAQKKLEADTADLSAKLADAQARNETLRKALARASMVIHEPTIPGCPPSSRLGPDFRLLFNAAVDGTAPVPANP